MPLRVLQLRGPCKALVLRERLALEGSPPPPSWPEMRTTPSLEEMHGARLSGTSLTAQLRELRHKPKQTRMHAVEVKSSNRDMATEKHIHTTGNRRRRPHELLHA